MLGTGFLAGLLAKLAGLGAAAKVAVATTTAALTFAAAGVTAAVLPSGGSDSDPGVIQGLTVGAATAADTATPPTSGETGAPAGAADSTVTTNTPSASTSAAVGAGDVVKPPAPTGPVTAPLASPSLPVPAAGLPDVSGLTQIPTQVLSCLAPIFDLVGSLPAVSPGQIGQIGPTIVGCVSQIVEGLPLPFGLNACISEILGFVSDLVGQLPGVPDVGGLDVAACIPAGLPVPGGLPFMGGGFPFGR